MDTIDKTFRSDATITPDTTLAASTLKTQVDAQGTVNASATTVIPGGNADTAAPVESFFIRGERYIKVETLSDNSGEGQVFLDRKSTRLNSSHL